jgi:hypothetical protein
MTVSDPAGTFITMIHAIDAVDWVTVRRCFVDEVDVDYSELFGQPRATMAADTLMAGWREIGGGFESTQHFIGPILLEEDGDRTRLDTHVRAYHRLDGDIWMVAGHYSARLGRPDGGWKIAALRLRVFYEEGSRALVDRARERGRTRPRLMKA